MTPEQKGQHDLWLKRRADGGVFSTFADVLYDKKMKMINDLHPSKGLEEVDRILSPATLILTEDDFEFLRCCGISTKTMILGEWK